MACEGGPVGAEGALHVVLDRAHQLVVLVDVVQIALEQAVGAGAQVLERSDVVDLGTALPHPEGVAGPDGPVELPVLAHPDHVLLTAFGRGPQRHDARSRRRRPGRWGRRRWCPNGCRGRRLRPAIADSGGPPPAPDDGWTPPWPPSRRGGRYQPTMPSNLCASASSMCRSASLYTFLTAIGPRSGG